MGDPFHTPLAEAIGEPYWLMQDGAPAPAEPLTGVAQADLAIIGAGYSGLWTALLAKERDPERDVVVIEAGTAGWAASGRNGGFCSASLTHGFDNGISRFPAEMELLERLGLENLDEIEATVRRYDIDCDWERTGELNVATTDWQLQELLEYYDEARERGLNVRRFDRDEVRAEIDSPTYLGAVWDVDSTALVDPARLVWGLREACAELGVRFYDNSRVEKISAKRGVLRLHTWRGRLEARQVALATGAHGQLLRRLRHWVVPVYDYALITEPLTAAQLAAVGWRQRMGVGDSANQFHYYRLTADNRILWGGYDAVYYNGGRIAPERDLREETFRLLAEHFYETFPQLADVRFTHKWGGIIDTCSRFSAFFGTAFRGRLAYAVGYTGLGVGATRFGAKVMLDLLGGEQTPLTRLKMVRRKPVPFPPEPIRSWVIQVTRRSIAQADRNGGRRNLWLRTLDRFGLGFDS
ncbi:FAD-dependent oxidoreductase [Actinoplanes sp. SE50]|uniref:NAD(P)/FAD-dependent oxidoreductase n=1 Tax=unclassified Actinoplanes TaxID=2626549 RepID=UPI00023ED3F8|nr:MULTISPECIES: FAD-dependent oxidoreductase [unclassified Actinoplanes]AEV83364.1 Gamma-glutamylputrescine oxidoreductase [Actinoplanes sp. SE50/110]ATO81757.1 FAD-dependent oxidoreductase [Actinoplanes sp. SE50]SLL99165.1 FAD-dependent oxidoreductase [Actinoplanes sp. SE50/110]